MSIINMEEILEKVTAEANNLLYKGDIEFENENFQEVGKIYLLLYIHCQGLKEYMQYIIGEMP